MVIVIIDSGVSDRYTNCKKITFPMTDGKTVHPIASGHGTAIYSIINEKCSEYAEIINFRILDIENGIPEDILISALEYILHNLNPDIINLSLGITECSNIKELYDVCLELTNRGSIIVSAFDNAGSISYPAAFDNVIGVISGSSCSKIDDFEFFDDAIVNVGAKGGIQRLVWDNPQNVFLSGNSFACAHVTSKAAEMIMQSSESLSQHEILERFKKISVKVNPKLPDFNFPSIPFDINRAVLFPFSKEMHSLLRYNELLDFKIVDIYDIKYSAKIGSNTSHLMNDPNIPLFTIKNINSIDYSNFDTLILGHMEQLSFAIKDDSFVTNLISSVLKQGKNVFSFDDVEKYGFAKEKNLYFPSVKSNNVPPNRFGMLYQNAIPVVGIFGTSSKQGKLTLQLAIRTILLRKGYSVGEIGTEPTSQLYGMDYVFPMGYSATVYTNHNETIRYLNTALHNIHEDNKDIVIVGSQSGTIPYAYGNTNQFSEFQYSFLLGTLPDCIILCINMYDSDNYIKRTISFLESVARCKVIGLATIPLSYNDSDSYTLVRSNSFISKSEYDTIRKSLESTLQIPLYNITQSEDVMLLTEKIIDFFS